MELGSPGGHRRGERGFTLIEVTIAMGLAAFAFAALASAMAGGLRTLAAEKTRARANEVATQAIEDLQRLNYDGLGLCAAASTSPPSGLTDMVTLPNCPSPVTNTYGQQPCDTSTAGVQVPASRYTCTRSNIVYTVTRYVVWADPTHTVKRLAVFVTWTDRVGNHEVTQQSSIRSPSVASLIGLSPPALTSPVVNPSTVPLSGSGAPTNPVSLSVTSSGLSSTDRVVATFSSLGSLGEPTQSSVALTNSSGSLWTGQIDTSFTFGTGSQFLSFAAVRSSDGKANSITSSVVKFCPAATDPNCTLTVTLPTFGTPIVPDKVTIDASGALTGNVSVSVTTQNVTTDDSVSFAFQTLSGSVRVFMQPDPLLPCTIPVCTWRGTIPATSGYAFGKGAQTFYFTAEQIVNPDPLSVDKGSTVAKVSNPVTFE